MLGRGEAQITIQTSYGIYAYSRGMERRGPRHQSVRVPTYRCLRCDMINSNRTFLQLSGKASLFLMKKSCEEGDMSAIDWQNRQAHVEGCMPITQNLSKLKYTFKII